MDNFEICRFEAVRARFQNSTGEIETPLARLLEILQSAKCETVVLEKQYVDADFKAGFGRFYYLHHQHTERWCERVHFFATVLDEDELFLMSESTKESYLGYSVLRPLPSHKAGRTVLASSLVDKMFEGLYEGEDRILSCRSEHRVNIAGNNVGFVGTPWIQQDKLIAACASAAIWIANWHLCHLYRDDFRRFTTTQITDLAVRFNMSTGRGMPSDGLHVEQMVSAMHAMGYEPFLKIPEDWLSCKRTIYDYVESGIPIIAIVAFPEGSVFQMHAVTVVGYHRSGRPLDNVTRVEHGGRKRNVEYASDYVSRFIVQDDSGGPFRFLEILDWNAYKASAKEQKRARETFPCAARFDDRTSSKEAAFVSALLIPVPRRVTLRAEEAERNARLLVQDLFFEYVKKRRLSIRTLLQPSNRLKTWWEPRPAGQGRPLEVSFALRQHNLPNWVWITEFGESDGTAASYSPLGQVIQDCSGRGAHAPWDDTVAIIGPKHLSLFDADPREPPKASRESLSEAIARFNPLELEQRGHA